MRITRRVTMVAVAATVATTCLLGPAARSLVHAAPPADTTFSWLEAELTHNGGTLPSSFDPTQTDWGLTLDSVLALTAGGHGGDAAPVAAMAALDAHLGDYITGEAFGDTGSAYAGPIGKALLTVELRGGNGNAFGGVDLEAKSRAAVQAAGKFAGRFSDVSTFGDNSNGFGQALNIMALSRTATGVPEPAILFLLAQQCPAGGFRLFYDAAVPADSTSGCVGDAEIDTDSTALAVSALHSLLPNPTASAAIDRATAWLLAHQDATTGGFGGTGPTASVNSNTTAIVVQALNAVGLVDAAARGRNYVAGLQLTAASTTGTPAAGEEGAIARDAGARSTALSGGIDPLGRDQWRRATAQGVLAFGLMPFGAAPSAAVTAVTPARLLDTRPGETTVDGAQAGSGAQAAGSTLVLSVTGRGGVPADVAAVVLNVTAVGATGPGYVTVYACDATRPLASNINFTAGSFSPNAVITKVSAAGTVCLYTAASSTNLLADVSGYFPKGTGYLGLTPVRLLDTRTGETTIDGAQAGTGAQAAGSTLVLPVAGRGGVPDADAVVLNVTSVGATGPGFVTVYACDATRPLASNINFTAGSFSPNAVITKVSATGTVCLYTANSSTHLIADVNGFFPRGSGYAAVTPARLLDTRPGETTVDGVQAGAGPQAAGATLVLPVAGRGGVPADAAAVVLNVTAVGATGPGYVTVYACDATRPLASNINFTAGSFSPNAVITKVSATGTVCLYTAASSTHLIADVSGSFGVILRLSAVLALAVTATTVAVPSARAEASYDGPCTDNVGITVVVDFRQLGGGVNVRCAPGPVTSGLDTLDKAGVTWEGARRFPGLVCRIAGKPGPDTDACVNAPPATAYWSYWAAPRGGQWCYSTFGAGNRRPPPGSVEGWSFSAGNGATDSEPPGYVPPPPIDGQPPNPLAAGDCGAPVDTPTTTTTTTTTPPPATVAEPAPPSTQAPDVPAPTTVTAPTRANAPAAPPPAPPVVAAGQASSSTSPTATTVADPETIPTTAPTIDPSTVVPTSTVAAPGVTPSAAATTTSVAVPGAVRSASGIPTSAAALGTVDLSSDGRGSGGFGLTTALGIVALVALAGTAVWAARRRRARA